MIDRVEVRENSTTAVERSRLRWQCRRGMLELDLLLDAFLECRYEHLSPMDKESFARLLRAPDSLLYGYLMGDVRPVDVESARLIRSIRDVTAS